MRAGATSTASNDLRAAGYVVATGATDDLCATHLGPRERLVGEPARDGDKGRGQRAIGALPVSTSTVLAGRPESGQPIIKDVVRTCVAKPARRRMQD